jgi:hypothetical protein
MEVTLVGSVLPEGLQEPDLEILRPTEATYGCLLLQPSGPVFACPERIGNFDRTSAADKARQFLGLAQARGAHLAVTPEYFLPWDSLKSALRAGVIPASDALWVLGCESTNKEDLLAFKENLSEECVFLHEPFDSLPADRSLLDPLVLLFQSPRKSGGTQLVALVQFKTFPSRDNVFLEERILKRGKVVYKFRGATGHLSVAAIICSDAFPADTIVGQLNDRATLIHIQLNPNPRNEEFRRYRATTFATDPKTSDCHIVCLNWAQSILEHGDGASEQKSWKNIAGSAWYCPLDGCSSADSVVSPNHQLGVYYTYLRERRHALLLHYDEATFELQVPKIVTTGRALIANRNGPFARRRYVWDANAVQWIVSPNPPDSGFEGVVQGSPGAAAALVDMLTGGAADPLGIERLLALTAGTISGTDTWYSAHSIDSCQMEPAEIVRRITVAQDPCLAAREFRHARLSATVNVRDQLDTRSAWPPQVSELDKDARMGWTSAKPHFNVITGTGKPTLIAYLGEDPHPRRVEDTATMLTGLLRRDGSKYQRRLCILYRHLGAVQFGALPDLTAFDDALDDVTDIAKVQPLA